MQLKSRKKTKNQFLWDIINQYQKATKAIKINMKEVAAWAVREGLWQASHKNAIKQCAHELARAASHELYTDPQGRRVRKKHATRQTTIVDGEETQLVLWADIETAPPEHMKLSLQQRRGYIVGDCKQLKTDLDSYNQNNRHGAQIQLSFNFTEDLEELDMPTEYNPE